MNKQYGGSWTPWGGSSYYSNGGEAYNAGWAYKSASGGGGGGGGGGFTNTYIPSKGRYGWIWNPGNLSIDLGGMGGFSLNMQVGPLTTPIEPTPWLYESLDHQVYPNYNPSITVDASKSASNSGGHYLEGSYSFDKTFIQYMPNAGLLRSWSNVRGSVKVFRGNDGKYYANVSATGYTPVSTTGTVTYFGSVDVLSSSVINSYSLVPILGSSIIQNGRLDVGNAIFTLPEASGDVFLRFNVGYTYSEGVGADVPYPGQGHFNIQIGFTIDGWTY